ncbi:YqgE/AlgH family protein [soil metagenome]
MAAASNAPARGRLIIATPDLNDPNFDGTVVLLLEHGPEGALGVVLNRPSELSVQEAMTSPPTDGSTGWTDLVDTPGVIFVGGPVRPNAVIALARVPAVADPERWESVTQDLGVINLGDGPLPEVGSITALRVFAGYAGWGAQQLEDEISDGAWFIVDALPADCFSADPDQLWLAVLRRQGGMFTTVTDNPLLN